MALPPPKRDSQLVARLGAVFLDIDTVTEPVVKAGLSLAGKNVDDRDSPEFKSAFREQIYEVLFNTAIVNLSHIDVVIAGPFTKEFQDTNWLDSLVVKIGFTARAYYITADPKLKKTPDEAKHPQIKRNWRIGKVSPLLRGRIEIFEHFRRHL